MCGCVGRAYLTIITMLQARNNLRQFPVRGLRDLAKLKVHAAPSYPGGQFLANPPFFYVAAQP